MKIEKISDTQVKFILTQDDLTDKNIKLEDLAVSNDKTKELFQDILSKALDECGFDIDDAPVALDSIMIIVTKLNTEDMQSKDSSSAPIISKDLHRYKRNSITVHNSEGSDNSDTTKYSFENLDNAIDVCLRLSTLKFVGSSLYKNNGKYYLVLQTDSSDNESLSFILSEYGERENSNILVKYHLMEHGETIISENAVEILAENFM